MKTMKQSYLFILTLFVASVFTFSCKSDDDGGGGGSAAEGTISAKIDGNGFTSVEMATFATISGGSIQIQGNTGGTSSKAIVMTITSYDGVGTYPIGGGANVFNVASYVETEVDLSDPTNPNVVTWAAPYDDTQVGEINISEVTDTHIKGTFSFKAKNEAQNIKNITEGSFNIALN